MSLCNDIVAFRAGAPQGAWRPLGKVGAIPAIAGAMTYNATVHADESEGRHLVVGYNVNALDVDRLVADAALYRPRFLAIDLPAPS